MKSKKNKLTTVASDWLTCKACDIKRNTYDSYLCKTQQTLKYFKEMGVEYVEDIDYKMVQDMITNLYHRGFGKSTIKKHKTTIKAILNHACKQSMIDRNPVLLVDIPQKAPQHQRRCLNTSEENILRKNDDKFFSSFALLLYYTGLRLSEAIPLKWSDIDFKAKTITVQRVVSYSQGRSCIDNYLKNGDKKRVIPIYSEAEKILNQMSQNTEFLFFNKSGRMMARNTCQGYWKRYQEETGLLNVTPHMLRHTFATNLYKAKVDLKTIQKITGHKNLEVLFNRYIHGNIDMVMQSTAAVDIFFKSNL